MAIDSRSNRTKIRKITNDSLSKNMLQDLGISGVAKFKIAFAASILGIGVISITPAQAATFNYSGDTSGSPLWDRNGGTTYGYHYDVFSFNVDVGGSYSFNSISPYDN